MTESTLKFSSEATDTSFGIFWPSGATNALKREASQKKDVKAAVFTYIRAMRALGRTKLNSNDIAAALSLRPSEVEAVLPQLGSKGVKVRR